jgi:hypothetical protein
MAAIGTLTSASPASRYDRQRIIRKAPISHPCVGHSPSLLRREPALWHADCMNVRYEDIGSQEPATKGDIEQLREDLQADMTLVAEELRGEMRQFENRLAKRIEQAEQRYAAKLDEWGRLLFRKIDAVVENRFIDLGAAKTEQVLLLDDKVQDHEQRIAAIEGEGGRRADR